jgi:formyltetrahydrofolate synthetase
VIAVNRFPTDTPRELETLQRLAEATGVAKVAVTDAFQHGSAGAEDLASAVVSACDTPNRFQPLYPLELPLREKLRRVAIEIYGAADIQLSTQAGADIDFADGSGFGELPVCIAKTQYSLSHDPRLVGRPRGFVLPIREVRIAAGAGFVYALAGDISTMPGLPKTPAASRIDIDANGEIVGM